MLRLNKVREKECASAEEKKKNKDVEKKKDAFNFVYETNVAVCQSHTAYTHSSVVIGIVETYSKYINLVLFRRKILEILNIRHFDSLSRSLSIAITTILCLYFR